MKYKAPKVTKKNLPKVINWLKANLVIGNKSKTRFQNHQIGGHLVKKAK